MEALISMLLIGLLSVAVLNLLPTSRRCLQRDIGRAAALGLARDLLEQARASDFASLTGRSGSSLIWDQIDGTGQRQPVRWEVQVESLRPELKHVQIALTFEHQTLVLETLIVKEEPCAKE